MLAFLQVIWDFKAFTQVYALRRGGPDSSTTTLPILIYQVRHFRREEAER